MDRDTEQFMDKAHEGARKEWATLTAAKMHETARSIAVLASVMYSSDAELLQSGLRGEAVSGGDISRPTENAALRSAGKGRHALKIAERDLRVASEAVAEAAASVLRAAQS